MLKIINKLFGIKLKKNEQSSSYNINLQRVNRLMEIDWRETPARYFKYIEILMPNESASDAIGVIYSISEILSYGQGEDIANRLYYRLVPISFYSFLTQENGQYLDYLTCVRELLQSFKSFFTLMQVYEDNDTSQSKAVVKRVAKLNDALGQVIEIMEKVHHRT